jgi:hypothetical protein
LIDGVVLPGLELCPPGFVASSEKLWKSFSLSCTLFKASSFLHLPASAFVETGGGVDEIAWFARSHWTPL